MALGVHLRQVTLHQASLHEVIPVLEGATFFNEPYLPRFHSSKTSRLKSWILEA